jgi:hypothetical protein
MARGKFVSYQRKAVDDYPWPAGLAPSACKA